MYPRHSKWNMICLLILFETFLNALFMDSDIGCGPEDDDQFASQLVDKAMDIVTSAIVAAPFMALIAGLLAIDDKYKNWVKTAPISFKT